MPAISIDTFFACLLMVLLVLTAMAATARILQPLIKASTNVEAEQRLCEVARRILLYTGNPADWGKNEQTIPEEFGLAEVGISVPYALDVDKVSRLNNENIYSLSYAQIFTGLKAADISLRIEVKPVFNVKVNQTATFSSPDEIVYTFEATTEKGDGAKVSTILKAYVLMESLVQAFDFQNVDGQVSFNITLPKDSESPAVLAVFAKSTFNSRIAAYAVYPLAHSGETAPKNAFLKLSPINHNLIVTPTSNEIVLGKVYALTFHSVWQLTQTTSHTFSIPASVDPCPTVLVAFGSNASQPFVEWTAYPQVPVEVGVDFASSLSTSDVYAYTHLVSVGNGIYKCTIFLGGPKP